MTGTLLVGNVFDRLAELPAGSVQCAVTSPPYFGLRAYGTDPQVWGGEPDHAHTFDRVPGRRNPGGVSYTASTLPNHATERRKRIVREGAFGQSCACGAWLGELGSEPDPLLFVDHLVLVFRALRRVLADSGTLFLNIGDSYAGSGKGPSGKTSLTGMASAERRQGFVGRLSPSKGARVGSEHGESGHTSGVTPPAGYKPKDLYGIPWLLALALQRDGWYWRSTIVWVKRACLPEAVTDRPTNTWEPIFLLSKSRRYFWDKVAVMESTADSDSHTRGGGASPKARDAGSGNRNNVSFAAATLGPVETRNMRNVWTLSPEPFSAGKLFERFGVPWDPDDDHFAAYPSAIPDRAIRAATSEAGQCRACGTPWRRLVRTKRYGAFHDHSDDDQRGASQGSKSRHAVYAAEYMVPETTGWMMGCACYAGAPVPQRVLDPFLGTGTTAVAAERLGRDWFGVELNATYARIADFRIRSDAPLFNGVELAA